MQTIALPLTELLVISLFTETLVEVIKAVSPKKISENGINIFSLFIGIGLAIILHVSIFTEVPQDVVLCGSVICGAIASRGSNFVHSFMDAMYKVSKKSTEKK